MANWNSALGDDDKKKKRINWNTYLDEGLANAQKERQLEEERQKVQSEVNTKLQRTNTQKLAVTLSKVGDSVKSFFKGKGDTRSDLKLTRDDLGNPTPEAQKRAIEVTHDPSRLYSPDLMGVDAVKTRSSYEVNREEFANYVTDVAAEKKRVADDILTSKFDLQLLEKTAAADIAPTGLGTLTKKGYGSGKERTLEYRKKAESLASDIHIREEYLKVLDDYEKSLESNGKPLLGMYPIEKLGMSLQNLFKGAKNQITQSAPQTLLPFVGEGIGLGEVVAMKRAEDKYWAGEQLTNDEKVWLDRRKMDIANSMISRDGAYNIGQMVVQMPKYAVEFYATSELAAVGKAGTLSALGKEGAEGATRTAVEAAAKATMTADGSRLILSVSKDQAKSIAADIISGAVGNLTRQVGFIPTISQQAATYTLPTDELFAGGEGELTLKKLDEGDTNFKAALKAIGVNYAETGGENLGFILEDPLDILKRATLGKYLTKYKSLGYAASKLNSRVASIGWNGVVPEVFEEAITEYAQAPIEGRKPQVSWEWLMQTAGATVLFGGLTTAMNNAVQNGVQLQPQGATIDIQIDPEIQALTSERPNNELLQEAETIISGKGKFGEEGIQRLEEIKSQLPENEQSQLPDIIVEAAKQDVIDYQTKRTEQDKQSEQNKKTKEVDPTEALIAEARKYKSADEFFLYSRKGREQLSEQGIKSQEAIKNWWNENNVEKNIIDSINPTGSALVDYTPQKRMEAELGKNITTLDKTSGKPANTMITVYRGSPKSQKAINPGDFITTNYDLAKSYSGSGNVISARVQMGDVLDDITEPLGEEYIYRPKTPNQANSPAKQTLKAEIGVNVKQQEEPQKEKVRAIQNEGIDINYDSDLSFSATKYSAVHDLDEASNTFTLMTKTKEVMEYTADEYKARVQEMYNELQDLVKFGDKTEVFKLANDIAFVSFSENVEGLDSLSNTRLKELIGDRNVLLDPKYISQFGSKVAADKVTANIFDDRLGLVNTYKNDSVGTNGFVAYSSKYADEFMAGGAVQYFGRQGELKGLRGNERIETATNLLRSFETDAVGPNTKSSINFDASGYVGNMRYDNGADPVATTVYLKVPRVLLRGSKGGFASVDASYIMQAQSLVSGAKFYLADNNPEVSPVGVKNRQGKVVGLIMPMLLSDTESAYIKSVDTSKTKSKGKSKTSSTQGFAQITKSDVSTTPGDLQKRIDNLNKYGQLSGVLRKGVNKRSFLGTFNRIGTKDGEIRIDKKVINNPEQYLTVLAHETGHSIEWLTTGSTNQRTGGADGLMPLFKGADESVVRDELEAVSKALVGEKVFEKGISGDPNYFKKQTELFARFIEMYMTNQSLLEEIAPSSFEAFVAASADKPTIQRFLEVAADNLDKRRVTFMRDRKEKLQKILGHNVGTQVYYKELTHRANLQRVDAQIPDYVKGKFKGVKDSGEALYMAAESIKETRNGQPIFGTKDYIQVPTQELEDGLLVEDSTKVAELERLGWVREGNISVEGLRDAKMSRERYSPDEAQRIYESLSPEGQRVIREFTETKAKAREVFNRNVLKDVYEVDGQVEGWVKRIKKQDNYTGRRTKLKERIAGSRKKRSSIGKVDTEQYVADLQQAITESLVDFEREKFNNKFIKDLFPKISKPIQNGKVDPGWVEVTGSYKTGFDAPQFKKRTIIEDGKVVPTQQTRYQIPKDVYERYRVIAEYADDASNAARVARGLVNFWTANVLVHPGTAGTNALSGGVQYGTKIINDFYLDLFRFDPKMTKTRGNIGATLSALLPKEWVRGSNLDWIWGGNKNTYYGQFIDQSKSPVTLLERTTRAYSNLMLTPFSAVEGYWKKVIALSENASDLRKLNRIGEKGLAIPTAEEEAAIGAIADTIDLYAYDYDNVAPQIDQWNKSLVGRSAVPFIKYPYKYAKHVTNLALGVFDANLSWQERMAKAMTLGTMFSLIMLTRPKDDDRETPEPGDNTPARLSPRGRWKVGTDPSGKEMFVRVAKYPFINITEAGILAAQGHFDEMQQILTDMLPSLGPLADTALIAKGYKSEYGLYDDQTTALSKIGTGFVPAFRIWNDLARALDPYKRKQSKPLQAFTQMIPTTDSDLQEKLHGSIRTEDVPVEGSIKKQPGDKKTRTTTTYNLEEYKQDVLLSLLSGIYITRIDPKIAEAYKIREEENKKKKQ